MSRTARAERLLPLLGREVLQQAGRRPSDRGPGKSLCAANPHDELNRSVDLESRADLVAPGILLERVRHGVVCQAEVRGPQESTLIDGPGPEQGIDGAIGAGYQEEAGATLELPPSRLDRR